MSTMRSGSWSAGHDRTRSPMAVVKTVDQHTHKSAVTPTNLEQQKKNFLVHGILPTFTLNGTEEELQLIKSKERSKIRFDLLPEAENILNSVKKRYGYGRHFLEKNYGPRISKDYATTCLTDYLETNKLTGSMSLVWCKDLASSARMLWCGPSTKVNKPESRRYSFWLKDSPENAYLRERGIVCLADHEIGTHFLRALNDGFQPWYSDRKRFGLKNHSAYELLCTEEGLASIHSTITSREKYLWTPALLYYTACKSTEMTFKELYDHLGLFVGDRDQRWKHVMRTKRLLSDVNAKGGYGKDQCYFEGAVSILRDMGNIDFEVLMCGRITKDEVIRIKRVARLNISTLPHFMTNMDEYRSKLHEIATLNGLLEPAYPPHFVPRDHNWKQFDIDDISFLSNFDGISSATTEIPPGPHIDKYGRNVELAEPESELFDDDSSKSDISDDDVDVKMSCGKISTNSRESTSQPKEIARYHIYNTCKTPVDNSIFAVKIDKTPDRQTRVILSPRVTETRFSSYDSDNSSVKNFGARERDSVKCNKTGNTLDLDRGLLELAIKLGIAHCSNEKSEWKNTAVKSHDQFNQDKKCNWKNDAMKSHDRLDQDQIEYLNRKVDLIPDYHNRNMNKPKLFEQKTKDDSKKKIVQETVDAKPIIKGDGDTNTSDDNTNNYDKTNSKITRNESELKIIGLTKGKSNTSSPQSSPTQLRKADSENLDVSLKTRNKTYIVKGTKDTNKQRLDKSWLFVENMTEKVNSSSSAGRSLHEVKDAIPDCAKTVSLDRNKGVSRCHAGCKYSPSYVSPNVRPTRKFLGDMKVEANSGDAKKRYINMGDKKKDDAAAQKKEQDDLLKIYTDDAQKKLEDYKKDIAQKHEVQKKSQDDLQKKVQDLAQKKHKIDQEKREEVETARYTAKTYTPKPTPKTTPKTTPRSDKPKKNTTVTDNRSYNEKFYASCREIRKESLEKTVVEIENVEKPCGCSGMIRELLSGCMETLDIVSSKDTQGAKSDVKIALCKLRTECCKALIKCETGQSKEHKYGDFSTTKNLKKVDVNRNCCQSVSTQTQKSKHSVRRKKKRSRSRRSKVESPRSKVESPRSKVESPRSKMESPSCDSTMYDSSMAESDTSYVVERKSPDKGRKKRKAKKDKGATGRNSPTKSIN